MKRVLLYLMVAFAIAGCTTKEDFILFSGENVSIRDANSTVTKIKHPTFEYKIQSHDRISITMYNHPELGTTTIESQRQDITGVLVDSKGYVRLPLIKSIHIAGLTQPAAQEKIIIAYRAYLEDADLDLQVLNKRAFVMGEVRNPGEILLFNEKATLVQVLAKAGDLTDFANRHAIVIMRHRNDTVQTETVDLTGVNSIRMANLMIYPNDVIYVTPNNMKSFNISVNEISPAFNLLGSITQPIVNVLLLENIANQN